jgi:hypothetical protein
MALVIIFGVIAWATGHLRVGKDAVDSNPSNQYPIVCGVDIISKVNVVSMPPTESDQEVLAEAIEEFTKNSDYENDPTCRAVMFLQAFAEQDVDTMRDNSQAVRRLAGEGHFVDNRYRWVQWIDNMDMWIGWLSTPERDPSLPNIDEPGWEETQ